MQPSQSKSSTWNSAIIIAVVVVCCVRALSWRSSRAAHLYYALAPVRPHGGNRPLPGGLHSQGRPDRRQPSALEFRALGHGADTLRSDRGPENDLYDLGLPPAGHLRCAATLPAPTTPSRSVISAQFWVMNSDTTENFQVHDHLRYITPHSYFWLEDGIDAKDTDIAALMTAFEDKIYPTDRRFFGSGVDARRGQ